MIPGGQYVIGWGLEIWLLQFYRLMVWPDNSAFHYMCHSEFARSKLCTNFDLHLLMGIQHEFNEPRNIAYIILISILPLPILLHAGLLQ